MVIVEDDALLAREWMNALGKRGYQVSHHPTIDAGIAHCLRDWPDLIVLDAFFALPDGHISKRGGLTFCAELSRMARELARQMPVMVGVSGARISRYMPRHVFEGVSRQMMPVRLTKPFSTRTLLDAIDNLTRLDEAS